MKPRFWNQKVRDLPGELYILAKIFVKAKAGAKKESVLKTGVSEFKIAVKEPAKEGKANEADLQRAMYTEAKGLIWSHPLKYIALTPVYAIRLHMPVNLKGEGMDHTFAGSGASYQNLKSLILGGIFIAWYALMAIVFWSYLKKIKDWPEWGLILIVIPYVVVMYALVSHAETRYLLPVAPLYFLFFSVWMEPFLKRFRV